jgi:transcription antitermination factor NusB
MRAMRKRSLAREIALQALYQVEARGNEAISETDDFCSARSEDAEVKQFAEELIKGVREKQAELDTHIQKMIPNWELERLALIDRLILRLGTYEMLYRNDIPPVVSINESVNMAKKYSTKTSGSFVNGVLDKIYQNNQTKNKQS